MKNLAVLTCVVLLCINTKAQYSVPVSITKEYSIQVSNRIHARTYGMNLSKKQYQQIAKGINNSEKAINLLYKESLTPDCKAAVDNIRQTELNNFI